MKTAIPTHRIHGIKRDTTLPQRIGYPVTLASRKPRTTYIVRDLMFAGSCGIVIFAALVVYHFATR